jgi:Flp pilus assembly protein TadD
VSRRFVFPVALSIVLGTISGCSTTDNKGFSFSRKSRSKADPAYAAARKALKKPDLAFLAYADWKADIGQIAEARQSYENVLTSNPNNIDALLGLARVEQKAGRLAEAEKRYLQVMQLNPDSARAKHVVGQYYAEQKRSNEAIELLEEAVDVEPSNPSFRYDLGMALVNAGQTNEGLSHIALTVGEAEANYNIGYLLDEMGKSQEALPYLKHAVELKPELKQAQDLLAGIRSAGSQSGNIVNAVRSQGPVRTVSFQNYGPANSTVPQQQQTRQFQAQGRQQGRPQVQRTPLPVLTSGSTRTSAPLNNGYRPPQPASAAVPLLQPRQQPAASPQARTGVPMRGLSGLNAPTRRQTQQTIQQASATQAAPASTGLTPAQLQQLLQATK